MNETTKKYDRERESKGKREKGSRKKWKSFDSLIYQPNNVYFDVIRNFPQDIITVATVVIWSHIHFSLVWGGPQYNKFCSSFFLFFFLSVFLFSVQFSSVLSLERRSKSRLSNIFSMLYTQSTRRLSILFTCVYNSDMHTTVPMCMYYVFIYIYDWKCLNCATDKQTCQWL